MPEASEGLYRFWKAKFTDFSRSSFKGYFFFLSLFSSSVKHTTHTHTHTQSYPCQIYTTHRATPDKHTSHTQSYPCQTYNTHTHTHTHTELPLSNIHQTHILTSYLIHLPLSKCNPPTLLHYRLIVHTNLRFQVDGDVGTALSHFILCGHFVLSPILFCKVLHRT